MAKGNRKRANPQKKDEKINPKINENPDADIASLESIADVKEFLDTEAVVFQTMFDLNKTYHGYREQYSMHEYALKVKRVVLERFKSGAYKPPLIVQISKGSFRHEYKKEEIIRMLEGEITIIKQAMDNLRCQVEQRRDEFAESIIRSSKLLAKKAEGLQVKKPAVLGYRAGEKNVQKETDVLLETELEGKTPEQILEDIHNAEKVAKKFNKEKMT